MENLRTITEQYVCRGNSYKIMQFDATTEEELRICEHPFIAVHESYTPADMPLNGLQMLISESMEQLEIRIGIDAAMRKNNPCAGFMEMAQFIAHR